MTRANQFSNTRPPKTEGDLVTFPSNVFNSFFSSYSLEEGHHLLWELFKLSITGKLSKRSAAERENLICFYENLHDLLTTASATYTNCPENHLIKSDETIMSIPLTNRDEYAHDSFIADKKQLYSNEND